MPTIKKHATAIELARHSTVFIFFGVRSVISKYVGGMFGWYRNRNMMNGNVSTIALCVKLK